MFYLFFYVSYVVCRSTSLITINHIPAVSRTYRDAERAPSAAQRPFFDINFNVLKIIGSHASIVDVRLVIIHD